MARKAEVLVAALLVAACAAAPTRSPGVPGAKPSPGSTAEPTASPTASAAPARSPALPPSPTPSPSQAVTGLRFEQVARVDNAELYAAVAFRGGFLVGGCRLRPPSGGSEGGCADPLVLRSTDGRSWTEAIISGSADRQIDGLAETPLGLLAFGSDRPDGPPKARTVWRSTDGSRWEPFAVPAPDPIVFTRAFVLAGRALLIGEDSSYDLSVETEVWATTDGLTWTHGETPMSAKITAPPGLVAIGDECADVCPDDPPLHVRRSADGFTWAEDVQDPALAAGRRQDPAVAWAGRAVVGGALGDGSSAEATVWFDEPGGWRTVRLDGGQGYVVRTLIDAGDRLIAVGTADGGGPSRAWWTSNGQAWMSGVLDGIEDAYVAAWAGDDPLVVVVDYRSIWLSSD